MNRKEKRDAKNARHRANEIRRIDRKIDKMFQPFLPLLREAKRAQEFAVAIEHARKLAWESGALGFR